MKTYQKVFAAISSAVLSISALGGVFYAVSQYHKQDVTNLLGFLLNDTEEDLSGEDYDLNGDGKWNAADLTLMKRELLPAANTGKTLVAYYSASGTTEKIADYIVEAMNADTFVITPVQPYSDADLDWTDQTSRVVMEHNDENRHTELVSVDVPDWESYDNVFIGYPIWWREASWVVDDFVKENDFTGKNVIPFCTSMSSPLWRQWNAPCRNGRHGQLA